MYVRKEASTVKGGHHGVFDVTQVSFPRGSIVVGCAVDEETPCLVIVTFRLAKQCWEVMPRHVNRTTGCKSERSIDAFRIRSGISV